MLNEVPTPGIPASSRPAGRPGRGRRIFLSLYLTATV
jgi:hypothetical protein